MILAPGLLRIHRGCVGGERDVTIAVDLFPCNDGANHHWGALETIENPKRVGDVCQKKES